MEGGSQFNTEEIIPRALKLVFNKSKEKEQFGWKVTGGFCLIVIEIVVPTQF